jgi:hypothetical protein
VPRLLRIVPDVGELMRALSTTQTGGMPRSELL